MLDIGSETKSRTCQYYIENSRIPCPLDNKHFVDAAKLQKHLRKCNARIRTDLPHISLNINAGPEYETVKNSNEDISMKISDIPITELLEKVNNIFTRYNVGSIEKKTFLHDMLSEELSKDYGEIMKKHLTQISAILGGLEHHNLLSNNDTVMELGAGRGQVSYWLAKLLENKGKSVKVILIDRASRRHKQENKLGNNITVHRIRADIKDLNLNEVEILKTENNIIAVGKHLCGNATDYSLRCILQKDVAGFFLSFCCHHRCSWESFVGREFLLQNGISKTDFVALTKLASWAVDGERKNQYAYDKKDSDQFASVDRKEIGRKCKMILDYSRKCFMDKNGFKCSLYFYVDDDISLENLCIVGLRKETQ